jgi:hypothetical protein
VSIGIISVARWAQDGHVMVDNVFVVMVGPNLSCQQGVDGWTNGFPTGGKFEALGRCAKIGGAPLERSKSGEASAANACNGLRVAVARLFYAAQESL